MRCPTLITLFLDELHDIFIENEMIETDLLR